MARLVEDLVAEAPTRRGRKSKTSALDARLGDPKLRGVTPEIPAKKSSAISAPRFHVFNVRIHNKKSSPLVVCAFSQKARQQMRDAQEAGQQNRSKKVREAKDFSLAYEGARRRSTEGWDGFCVSAIRNACISACRLVGFKMTLGKLSVFVEADGVDKNDGTPLVRIDGTPKPFESLVRVANGSSDIRVRPRFDEWSAELRVRFDADQFSATDIYNLLRRAGAQVGIGEGRPDSRESNGQGWGLFELDQASIWIDEGIRENVELHFRHEPPPAGRAKGAAKNKQR